MIRVMLVEDEWLVREGLRRMIPWEAHGFEVIAEADNGETALEMYRQMKPDVVFTDIRMPGMDGMELIARIRAISLHVPICVLSSHTDFQLVQQGIRHGVFEYLDKLHLSSGEIEQCMVRLRELLRSREGVGGEAADAAAGGLAGGEAGSAGTGAGAASGGTGSAGAGGGAGTAAGIGAGASSAVGRRGKLSVELSPLTWLKENAKAAEGGAEPADGWVWVIGEIAEGTIYPWEHEGFLGDFPYTEAVVENRIFLDAERRIHMVLRHGEEASDYFCGWFNPYLQCAFTVSDPVTEARQWETAFRQAEELLTDLFYSGWNQYLVYAKKRHYRLDAAPLSQPLEAELLRLIAGRKEAELMDKLDEAIDRADGQDVHPKRFKQALVMLLLRGLSPDRRAGGGTADPFGDAIGRVQRARTREELSATLAGLLRSANGPGAPAAMSPEVVKALAFMRDSLGEKLTLARIAEIVHLNPNYFATLFKEQTGETPMNKLTAMRLEQARMMLLQSPELSVQEVAESVGFVNLSHFSRLFKQATGRTPSEFRSS